MHLNVFYTSISTILHYSIRRYLSEFGLDALSILQYPRECIVTLCWVVALPTKVPDLLDLLRYILWTHLLWIKEASLLYYIITYDLCHLSLATNPPPT